MGRAVDFEAFRRLDLHRIVVPSVHGQEHTAVVAGGDSIYQSTIHLPDFKGDIGDALGLVTSRHLNELQPALRFVEEGHGLGHTTFNKDTLRSSIQHIAAHGLGLLGGNGDAGGEVSEDDAAIAIRHILAVVRPKHLPRTIGNEEGHALDGNGGAVHILLNG